MICSAYSSSSSWSGSRNMSTFIETCLYVCHFFLCFLVKESGFICCAMCTYAPGSGLLIANQKLCFHSDCLSPLWKVFPVVTKTTIQQWQMNVAHSWVMRWSLDKQAQPQNWGQVGKWKDDNERVEWKEKHFHVSVASVVLIQLQFGLTLCVFTCTNLSYVCLRKTMCEVEVTNILPLLECLQ